MATFTNWNKKEKINLEILKKKKKKTTWVQLSFKDKLYTESL